MWSFSRKITRQDYLVQGHRQLMMMIPDVVDQANAVFIVTMLSQGHNGQRYPRNLELIGKGQ
jgi:hypothetical protein